MISVMHMCYCGAAHMCSAVLPNSSQSVLTCKKQHKSASTAINVVGVRPASNSKEAGIRAMKAHDRSGAQHMPRAATLRKTMHPTAHYPCPMLHSRANHQQGNPTCAPCRRR
jgi:hypothetical protein